MTYSPDHDNEPDIEEADPNIFAILDFIAMMLGAGVVAGILFVTFVMSWP